MRQRPLTDQERAELRDYSLLWRLAFPSKSRASVRRYRKRNPLNHAEIYKKHKTRNPAFNIEKRTRNLDGRRRYERDYRAKHKKRLNARGRRRRKVDLNWRLRCVLRCLLNRAVQRDWKSGSAIELLGCSIASFKLYLESRFEVGMNWGNYGKGIGRWNIDHIIPCALFDLTKLGQQRACFHFSNQQPMWAVQNSSKGCKLHAMPCS